VQQPAGRDGRKELRGSQDTGGLAEESFVDDLDGVQGHSTDALRKMERGAGRLSRIVDDESLCIRRPMGRNEMTNTEEEYAAGGTQQSQCPS